MSKAGLNLVVSLSVSLMSVSVPSVGYAQTANDRVQAVADKIKEFNNVLEAIITDKMNAASEIGSAIGSNVSSAAKITLNEANNGLDVVSDNSLAAFKKFKSANPATYNAALAAEYVYWLTMYGSLIVARKGGDLTGAALATMGSTSPEVQQSARELTNRVILWSPALLVAGTEIKRRFGRLGYAVPVTSVFLKDAGRFLESFYGNGKMRFDGKHFMKSGGALLVNSTANVTMAAVNYGYLLSWIFISRDDINLSIAPIETIRAAEAEVAQRLIAIRAEMPSLVKVDEKLAPYDESIRIALAKLAQ